MVRLISRFWKDDGGALLSTEWVFMATLLAIGMTTGLVAVRNSINAQLTSFANSVDGLNQCYSFNGLSTCGASTCGSAAVALQVAQIPFGQVTPGTPIETNLGGPCADVALPANFNRQPVNRVPSSITPAAAERPREECTDQAPSVRPAATSRRQEECTDEERARTRDTNVLPAATKRDRKP